MDDVSAQGPDCLPQRAQHAGIRRPALAALDDADSRSFKGEPVPGGVADAEHDDGVSGCLLRDCEIGDDPLQSAQFQRVDDM
jgi:hypothetical protein